MWYLVRICANHSPATCGGRRVLTIQTYGINAFEIIGRTAWLYQPIWLSSSACRVPRAEILAEFLSAHFQENRTKPAYFLWTSDLFCLKDQTHASALRFIYICTPADRWASNVNIFDIYLIFMKNIYIYLIYFRTWGIFGLFFYKDINLNFNYCMLISVVPSKTSTCVYIIVATYWSDCNCI